MQRPRSILWQSFPLTAEPCLVRALAGEPDGARTTRRYRSLRSPRDGTMRDPGSATDDGRGVQKSDRNHPRPLARARCGTRLTRAPTRLRSGSLPAAEPTLENAAHLIPTYCLAGSNDLREALLGCIEEHRLGCGHTKLHRKRNESRLYRLPASQHFTVCCVSTVLV